MLNTLPMVSTARFPRSVVKVNGVEMAIAQVPSWTEWEIDNNTFYQPDTFRVKLAVSALPKGFGADWFASQTAMSVEIFAGLVADPTQFTIADLTPSLIIGNVDDMTYDPTGSYIELSGRDFTSLLTDSKTTEKYPNNKSSDITAIFAGRHGLTTTNITATSTKVGKFYDGDIVSMSTERTEWDVLTFLAQQEKFVTYVHGKDLHFHAPSDPSSNPYVLQWAPPSDGGSPTFNGTNLTLSRNLTIAKDVIVIGISHNVKTGKTIKVTRKATHDKNLVLKGGSVAAGVPQTFTIRRANLDSEKLLKAVEAKLAEITAHEMRLIARLPADNIVSTATPIQLTGTGTQFDQVYFANSIVRSMSKDGGYTMTINAKNHPAESEVAL